MTARGVGWALTWEALVLVVVALLVVGVLARRTAAEPVQPLPGIYAQCVGNAHHSDVCLGA